MKKKSI